MLFIFEHVYKYPNVNNHSFSVCHLSSKNGVPGRRVANSARSSVTRVLFLPDNCHTLACSRSALWVLPILSHGTLKRCVLKGRYLIKLIIFPASSRTFLGPFFKPWMCGGGEYSDRQMPLPCFLLRHPPLPLHRQCKPPHTGGWCWPCSTPGEGLGPYFENHRTRANCLHSFACTRLLLPICLEHSSSPSLILVCECA